MIRTVIKFPNDAVVIFDEKGEQVFEYRGSYDQVKDMILRDAPQDASFFHAVFNLSASAVPREEW